MKFKNFLLILILVIFSTPYFAQVNPADLYDPDIMVRWSAINTIVLNNYLEYVPEIEEAIFYQEEPIMMYEYLTALQSLDSHNLVDIALEFINYADDFGNRYPPEDPLDMKVKATLILFDAGNYSTIENVFQIVNRDKPNLNSYTLDLLEKIIANVPEYEEEAKTELEYTMYNSSSDYSRYYSMAYLNHHYSNEYISIYLSEFTNDEDVTVRKLAFKFLFDLEYPDLKTLLHTRLDVEQDESLRAEIADSILSVYGEPSDLKAVIDYQPTEPDPDINTWIQYAIIDFIPPRPTVSTSQMIINLKLYVQELFQYGWITELSPYNQYLNLLIDLEKLYQRGDGVSSCNKINQVLEMTENWHNTPILTEEGYKFLHYHGTYIKENIESELGSCQN